METRKSHNLLFLMTDQFTNNALGCVDGRVMTPYLDRICRNGIRFDRCYSNAPLCLPARACLATGSYPTELGIMDNSAIGLTMQSQTWMQRIRDAGYETSMFGKVHLHRFPRDMQDIKHHTQNNGYQIVDEVPGPRTYGMIRSSYYDYLEERGLLELYREDMRLRYKEGPVYDSRPTPLKTQDYADVFIADRALKYLENVSGETPWFCTVGFGGPHDPWDTPAEYVDRYKDVTPSTPLPRPISLNPDRPRGVYDDILSGQYDGSLTEEILRMRPEDVTALRRSYYGHVTLIDDQIGRILSCLEQRDMLENTIIVFTSDHGEQNGDYGLLFKQTFFESSVRVPLIIALPEGNNGFDTQLIEQPVELMDLGVTLCDLLGLNEEMAHARSLQPLMRGGEPKKHRVISQLFGETMILKNDIKAVFNQNEEIYLLFDLAADPTESCNLAGSPKYKALEETMYQAFQDLKVDLKGERR